MNIFFKTVLITLACLVFSSCSIIQKNPDNKPVRLVFYNEININPKKTPDCKFLDTLVSSEGHWYSYLFISNDDLTQGAINDMHNKANQIGANLIYINDNIDFATSVTLLGQAYHCDEK
jgi:hypothetical protein